ncbi:MAG TPA: secretin N-terminal domain-containing protein, partial [Pirellulaceae bacterium]|nr:secretin N-terminal domain-containing protein [Pirellulaceae bacterium]
MKSDWSKATHGAEAKAGFEQRIKDLPIPEPLRRDVIANGYAILFSNAGLYEPARYESLVAWLALNDLLVGRIKGDSAARKAGTSHFAAVRVGDDRMPWTSNVEERPLVEQRQEIEWKVYQLDEASGGDLFGIMHRAVRATRPLGAQEFSRERLSNIETCRYTMPRDSVLVLPTLQQSENGGPASVLLRGGPPGARYRNLGSSTQQKYPDMLAEPAAVAMLSGRVEALLVIHAGVTGWPQVDSPSSPVIDVPNRVIEETPAPPASGFPLGWSGNRQPDWVDSELQENRQTTIRDRAPGRRASTNSPFSSRGAPTFNDMGAVMSNGFGAGGREPIRDQAESPATSLPAPTSVDPSSPASTSAKSPVSVPANIPADSARANLTFVDPVTGRASPVDPLVASGTSLKVPSNSIATGARGKERITVVGLRFLRAESVAVTLQQLFRDRASIVAEQRTNRLLVSADEAVIVELRELLDQLDRAPDASLVWRAEPTADGRVELREPRSGWTPAERQQIVQRLTEVAADADARVKSVAKQVVDAARKVAPTDPYFKELEDQLRVAIDVAFEAQDALESAQLSDFEFRIEGVKKALEFRRQNKRMVVE